MDLHSRRGLRTDSGLMIACFVLEGAAKGDTICGRGSGRRSRLPWRSNNGARIDCIGGSSVCIVLQPYFCPSAFRYGAVWIETHDELEQLSIKNASSPKGCKGRSLAVIISSEAAGLCRRSYRSKEMWRHRDGKGGTLLAVLEAGERLFSYR